MSASDIPPGAEQLHRKLYVDLNERIAIGTNDYVQFVCMAQSFGLPEGVIANCRNIIDVLNGLEGRAIITVGNYHNLKEILEGAKLFQLLNLVISTEQQMASTGRPTGSLTPESQTSSPKRTTKISPSSVVNNITQSGPGTQNNYTTSGDTHFHISEGGERNPP